MHTLSVNRLLFTPLFTSRIYRVSSLSQFNQMTADPRNPSLKLCCSQLEYGTAYTRLLCQHPIGALAEVPTTPLLIPANVSWIGAKYHLNTWVFATDGGNMDKILGISLSLCLQIDKFLKIKFCSGRTIISTKSFGYVSCRLL